MPKRQSSRLSNKRSRKDYEDFSEPNGEIEEEDDSHGQEEERNSDAHIEGEEEEDDGNEAVAGTISYILLENFMCHDKLELYFHKRITFINGPNGSGKSAILAGLQTCLGAKSSVTHRGSSIKDLIKAGREWAQITLKMRNVGDDAFRHDRYGDTITIIRKIDKRYGSSYKIKSTSGKTLATNTKELKLILEQFNIQIDNPTTFMTQDVSREFLANSTPKKKFEFFMRATQLQKMLYEFKITNDDKYELSELLADRARIVEKKDEHVKKLQQEYEDSKVLAEIENQMEHVRKKLLFAVAREKANEFEKMEEKVRQEERKVKRLEDSINQDNIIENQTLFDKLSEEIEGMKQQLERAKDETTAVDKQILEIGRRRTPFVAEVQEYKKRIEHQESQIKKLRKEIVQLREKSKIDRSAERQKIEKKLTSLHEDLSEIKARNEEIDKDVEIREQELSKRSSIVNELKRRKEEEESTRKSILNQADNLDKQKKDKMQFFHRLPLKDLLHEIEQKRQKFTKVPIGPIGLLTTIKDLKWAPAIELALKNDINNFICHNHEDQRTFQQIVTAMLRHRGTIDAVPPTVIVQPFSSTIYNVSLARPDANRYQTIMDMIELDMNSVAKQPVKYENINELRATIFNVLINQSHIECSILIEELQQARDIMFPSPPRGADNCYTLDGSRLFMRGSSENYIGANQKYSRLWSANKDDQIQELRDRAKRIDESINKINHEGKKAMSEKKELETQVSKLRKTQSAIKTEAKSKERALRKVEEELQAEEQNETENDVETAIKEYERSIEERNNEILDYNKHIESVQSQIDKLKQEENAKKQVRSQKMFEQSEQAEALKKRHKQLSNIVKEIENTKKRQKEGQNMLAKAKEVLHLLIEKYNDCKHYKEEAESAVEGMEQIDIGDESSEKIKHEQERLMKKFRTEQKRLGDRNVSDFLKKYKEAKDRFDDMNDKIKLSKESHQIVEDSLEERYKMWEHLRQQYMSMISKWFNAYLSQKGHSGQLNFNIRESELEMEVFLNAACAEKKKSKPADIKSLSGGERSFVTISFLLSLWQLIESPFRALDEVDIFMDAMYRKISLDLIIEETKKKRNLQLIIVSPHDTSNIKPDKKYLKLVRLSPPERRENQRTMDEFMRAHASQEK